MDALLSRAFVKYVSKSQLKSLRYSQYDILNFIKIMEYSSKLNFLYEGGSYKHRYLGENTTIKTDTTHKYNFGRIISPPISQ